MTAMEYNFTSFFRCYFHLQFVEYSMVDIGKSMKYIFRFISNVFLKIQGSAIIFVFLGKMTAFGRNHKEDKLLIGCSNGDLVSL